MTQSWQFWWWRLGLASLLGMGGAIATFGDCALAQIAPDSTLSAESSVVTPTNIDGLSTERIDGGATRGANLFHSFEKFSLPTGSAAYFNNALDIQNIISRVTGGSVSNIDGLIRANGTANLFLLNPNGIIFGPNAELNIGGSFLGSTASSINFADGNQFSAAAPQTTPLLTVSVPLGLQFGGTAGSILNQFQATNSSAYPVGLQVQPGNTLSLVGGNVRLEGGRLQAPGGRVELGGLAASGSVGLSINGSQMRLSFPDDVQRADVYLTNSGSNTAGVNVAASNGGSIAITAGNINMSGDSLLNAGLEKGKGFPGAQAGDIELRAQGRIVIADGLIRNKVEREAVGNSGNINITTGSLSVTNGTLLNTSTRGRGDAGSVNINARDTVSFNGEDSNGASSAALSSVEIRKAVGNSGNINITTGSLSVTNGAYLSTGTSGRGDAGRVNINADTVIFDGARSDGFPSKADSIVERRAVGNGGSINIIAGSLDVRNGALLDTSSKSRGHAGSVNINARDTVSFDGAGSNQPERGAFSRVLVGAVGDSGGINITAGSLFVRNGAVLSATTFGQRGDAGSLTIVARDTVSLDGLSSKEDLSTGVFSAVAETVVGKGGSIKITTGLLALTNGALLDATSKGSGVAGNIEVTARSILLDNQADLSSNTTAGQGNISLRSQDLVLRRGSNITTNATGTATGGNITIDTNVIVALENSDITANAEEAFGGQVTINAQGIFGTEFRNRPTPESDITASSDLGPQFSGTVEINTPDVDPSQGLATLPTEFIEASGQLIAQGCAALGENEFTVTGRGGLPPSPSDTLSSDTVWTDLRPMTEQAETQPISESATQPTNPTTEQLVEAQGWIINDKGEVVLTAHAPTVTPNNPWITPPNCHSSTSNQQPLALDAR